MAQCNNSNNNGTAQNSGSIIQKTNKMKVSRYEFVSVNVPASSTAQRYFFPDLPNLRAVSLNLIEAYNLQTISVDPNGLTISPNADFKRAFLVLYANESESLFRIPLIALNRFVPDTTTYVPGVQNLYEFNNQRVVWSKSYIQLGAAPSVSTAFNFCFGIFYS